GGESIVIASWPTPSGDVADVVAAQRVADMQKLVTEVRRFRSDQGLKPSQKVGARLVGVIDADLSNQVHATRALARLIEPAENFTVTASVEVRLTKATVTVELDTSGTVDLVAERARLVKDLAASEKELTQTTSKLSNEAFLAKAPDAVVDKIKSRQQIAIEEIARITARLETVGQL
ncbi:MAG: valine--tRNA ligase, partial [Rhodococcus sp. (in: high G+C Gram-positive bacteria)]